MSLQKLHRHLPLVLISLLSATHLYAASNPKPIDCAPVRIPNLSEQEVENLLLFSLDKYIEVRDSPDVLDAPIDVFRSKVKNYRDEELLADMTDALGVDVYDAIKTEARKENIKDPLRKFSLRRVLDIAKRTYLAGAKTPLPQLKPGTVFDATIFTLAVPMEDSWFMTRCAPNLLTFNRALSPNSEEVLAANSTAWTPYRSMQEFQSFIPAGTNILEGLGLNAPIAPWRPVKQAGPPCIETTAQGRYPVEIEGKETELPLSLYVRVCYSARYKERHYAHSVIMSTYTVRGVNKADFTARGIAIIAGVKSKSAKEQQLGIKGTTSEAPKMKK